MECPYCSYEPSGESERETHILLRHPEEVDDTSVYDSDVSEGHLDTSPNVEKGEQFGYDK